MSDVQWAVLALLVGAIMALNVWMAVTLTAIADRLLELAHHVGSTRAAMHDQKEMVNERLWELGQKLERRRVQ